MRTKLVWLLRGDEASRNTARQSKTCTPCGPTLQLLGVALLGVAGEVAQALCTPRDPFFLSNFGPGATPQRKQTKHRYIPKNGIIFSAVNPEKTPSGSNHPEQ